MTGISELICIANLCSDDGRATFDQLAEEVMELHLSLRGKHPDLPAMEWLEVATIAINAFRSCSVDDQRKAVDDWLRRHVAR